MMNDGWLMITRWGLLQTDPKIYNMQGITFHDFGDPIRQPWFKAASHPCHRCQTPCLAMRPSVHARLAFCVGQNRGNNELAELVMTCQDLTIQVTVPHRKSHVLESQNHSPRSLNSLPPNWVNLATDAGSSRHRTRSVVSGRPHCTF